MGTIAYMSPEQARGEAVDARTDLFSLGVVLYEMATGFRPFRGKTAEAVLTAIKTGKPDCPTASGCRIAPALEHVILKCLEKDPALRYSRPPRFTRRSRTFGGRARSRPGAGSS